MTSRRPSFTPNPRPSSAIFIGSAALPPLPSPPSPAHSVSSTGSQLPSPPATNSTGSIGDNNSTGTGSIRRRGMVNGDRHPLLGEEDEENNDQENNEDHTARLSNDAHTAKGKQVESDSSTIQRVKSLTERNRKVIDRLSSITASDSHSRSSLSPSSGSSSRSRSPLPPVFSSSASSSATSSSSRVSIAASLRGGSGSETEREQRQTNRQDTTIRPRSVPSQDASSDDNDATTPPASARRATPTFDYAVPRQRLRSAPSSPAKPPIPQSPRKHTSTTSFTVLGSGRRSRRVSIQHPGDDPQENESPAQPTASGSANKKSRAPLPREFRDRRSLDGRSAGELSNASSQDRDRTSSPGVFTARGSASMNSSGAGSTLTTSPASPVSPRTQRPARPSTLRDSSRRAQRWSSVDEAPATGDADGRRQWRHGGSAESALGGKEARSVVGEGLRAAGLTRRDSDDVFADGASQRRARSGINGSSASSVREDPDEPQRATTLPRDPHDSPPLSAPGQFGTMRSNNATIHSVLSGTSSRPPTSIGSYLRDNEAPRAASQPLRSHRASYGPGARHTPQSRSSPAVGTFGRGTQQQPSSEHARLMLDSLAMFEAQLARLPLGPSDLSRAAQGVVHSASGLNSLLRAGNARALESQIEAEVGDAASMVDSSEVWRQVGGEYRESVRVSDELVRTITALLLGMGRVVREAVKERSTGSPDLGGGSARSSLEEDREVGARAQRRSMDDGRSSVEGSIYRERESRRSWEDTGSVRRSQVDSRPSTSLSMARGTVRQGLTQDDGDETARERERSSALNRLSIRRIFRSRSREPNQDSPDSHHPSPSPAPRTSLDREQNRGLPPLTVPPPLPSLPSESMLEHKSSVKGRRSKISNTSTATVRGSSLFTGMTSPPNPTTALTPHTVSAGDATAFPLLRGDSSSTALSGLQQQQERDGRKRTISATSTTSAQESSSASSGQRVSRITRVRMSLDGAEAPQDVVPQTPAPLNGERRERRRTINDIFP